MTFNKGKTFFTMLVVVVVTALALAACGDTATNTPGAASGASTVTSGSATTAAMTTSGAMTTASATTAAMTTSGAMTTAASMTTAAMTTPAATTSGAAMTTDASMTTASAGTPAATTSTGTTTGSASFPSVTGLSEVSLNSTITSQINSSLKLTGATVKIYTTNDDATTASTNFDTALTGAGYAFAIPGQTKPITQGGNGVGLYSKSGSQDILFIAAPVPADTSSASSANLPGVNAQDAQAFLDQIKGKKTFVIAVSGTNLLQALLNLGASGAGSSGGAMTTAAATPTK